MVKKNSSQKTKKKGVARQRRIIFVSIGAAVVIGLALIILRFTAAANCTVNSKLVNSCRPWIGATSNSYPGVSGWKNHINYFEKRAGEKVDIAHSYHSPTQTSLNADELSFVNRPNTYLYMNWKPDTYWKPAGGGNTTVNKRIDQMATSIKKLGSKKIFLTVYHEPENDISKGGSKCASAKGNKGTTAEYRAMWKNVRKRFDAKGVNNVVWVMNYMGWQGWDCAVKDLWPGNDLVDWITWDPYTPDKSNFKADMSRFYNFLVANTDSSHAFTSKPWGIAELGYEGYDQQKAYKYYDDMLKVIQKNELPRIKMYLFFDMNGAQFGGDPKWDSRINYTRSGKKDNTEQSHFNHMMKGVKSVSTTQPVPTPSQPTSTQLITVKGISNGATVSGTRTISGKVNTTKPVKIVTLRVDGSWVETDWHSPYSFGFNTKKYKNGTHTLILRAMIDGKKYNSETITFTIKN